MYRFNSMTLEERVNANAIDTYAPYIAAQRMRAQLKAQTRNNDCEIVIRIYKSANLETASIIYTSKT